MKMTYQGQTHFENALKLRLLMFTITFPAKGQSVRPWILLILCAHIFNLFAWPLLVIWALKQLGLSVEYSWDTIIALFLLYMSARFLLDESKGSVT